MRKIDDEKSLYSISTVAELLEEHPETLRVWERKGLIKPDRSSYQRKYTNNDLKRLFFIKYLIDEKGFNVASVSHLLSMYPCYYNNNCRGGNNKTSNNINLSKPCWKQKGTYCIKISDRSEMCCCCKINQKNNIK